MAWSAPRTWVAGELVTAALGNAHWRDNLSLLKTSISDDGLEWSGRWIRTTATVTADTPLANVAQTWNAAGVTFTLLKANVTDTASAAASLLVDLQVGGSSKFKIDKAGNATFAGGLTIAAATKFYLDGGGNTYIQEEAADTISVFTGGTRRFQVASGTATFESGMKLGVGTTPSETLHVLTGASGAMVNFTNSHATTPSGVFVNFSGGAPNNASQYFWYCSDNTNVRAVMYSHGGLHNYSGNNVNLSDMRSKMLLGERPAPGGALRRIRAIEFVMDRYTDSKRPKPDLMWYAQQMAVVDSDFIDIWQHEKRDAAGNIVRPELLGTRDHQVFLTNVLATQELAAYTDDLAARIAALESRN